MDSTAAPALIGLRVMVVGAPIVVVNCIRIPSCTTLCESQLCPNPAHRSPMPGIFEAFAQLVLHARSVPMFNRLTNYRLYYAPSLDPAQLSKVM